MHYVIVVILLFVGEQIPGRLKKYKKGPLDLFLEIITLSYEILLARHQLPFLKVRQLGAIALESFKILNNLSPVYLSDLSTFKKILTLLGTQRPLRFHR